jgi:hypothetical protein
VNAAPRVRTACACALASAPVLLAWSPLRNVLESRMTLHMLVQLPLLLAAGWAASALLGTRMPLLRHFDRIDAGGLLGATLLTCVSLFWMVPAALDRSLLAELPRWAKYASWWMAGAALARSWPRLAPETLAFFAGNLAWMLATAGLLFQASDARLCVSYLLDDQVTAGRALVVAAVVLGAGAARRLVHASVGNPGTAIDSAGQRRS